MVLVVLDSCRWGWMGAQERQVVEDRKAHGRRLMEVVVEDLKRCRWGWMGAQERQVVEDRKTRPRGGG